MDSRFNKPYDPATTERRIYERWEQSGFFNPDKLPNDRGTTFTIVMPPPNANGNLHLGHAFFLTIEDLVVRYQRMRGRRALWLPGADHAGFETQIVYEKKLEKEGRSRFQLTPRQLYDEIYQFTLENKKAMEGQIRRLGASCDWSRAKFTLDPEIVAKVQKVFKKMFDDGLVYRGARIINWCPKHQTSLSDVETESVEEQTPFYYFRYGPFEIGTVRPETKFGDKYVVVHPNDQRYANYQHGQTLTVEWLNGPITATVIKDAAVDMNFGTGAMTITPGHSGIDFEIAVRHQLEREQIIDWRGRLLPLAGEFAGQKITEARPKIVEKLRQKGLLVRIDENYRNIVRRCYKCGTVIEPQVRDQWFVKMAPLAARARQAVANGQLRFFPENYAKIFNYWMTNTLDWNISRQIVWGIPIPAKICERCATGIPDLDNQINVCPKCGGPVRPDSDTFDTWFSSGQWPLLTTDWPDGPDFAHYYPTAVMATGHDLIFRWVPRMVIFGLYLTERVPFRDVYLHGLVLDPKRQKMSKSKGNVISPLDLIERYGTDALRMALVVGTPPGSDLAFSEDKLRGYKNFANKIWNIARFVFSQAEEKKGVGEENDQELLVELNNLTRQITEDFESYRFHLAAERLYHYIWDRFASEIVESSKKTPRPRLLLQILERCLILLHPFMPFITEEIWSHWPEPKSGLLLVESWPKLTTK